jgi:two-component system, OmpR family, phosphate regulon sensor histidine kinase PhoR
VNKLQLSRVLMIATILLIAGFQCYWLTRLYNDEKQGLRKEADVLFRETVYKLQLDKFKKDSLFNSSLPDNLFLLDALTVIKKSFNTDGAGRKLAITMDGSPDLIDTSKKNSTRVFIRSTDDKKVFFPGETLPNGQATKIMFRSSLNDSLSSTQIDSAYKKELEKNKVNVNFKISSLPNKMRPPANFDSADTKTLNTGYLTVGLGNHVSYRAELSNANRYLFGKITYPLIISLFLIAVTTASFVFLYRNLLAQRKLTNIKNDFISNITHELKTPLATVNVAIEALKTFNAIDNPERTREYLDISSSELQRLSLLVDKVLKLSLFENKEIELKVESFNLKDLIEDVIKTMQLQFNKAKAVVDFVTEGNNFVIEADKLHITSVIYNLLDNALKYSPDSPKLTVTLKDMTTSFLQISIADNGIGIPAEYQSKIFDKFFRVPHGNKHNIKGYGLGLSYVSHIIKKHNGDIDVHSENGKGSTFVVNLPTKETT